MSANANIQRARDGLLQTIEGDGALRATHGPT